MKGIMKKFNFKRVMTVILLLSILSGYLPSFGGSLSADVDANALQTNYINLMKGGKGGVDGNTDAIMTLDDLRNVAMYLSCSYVPFYTSLDGDSKDKWIEKSASMLTQIGFDSQVANTLVNAVYEASLDSASKIYVPTNSLGDVNTGSTGLRINGYGRNKVNTGILTTTSGWFMTVDGTGSSNIFVADNYCVVDDISYGIVTVNKVCYVNNSYTKPTTIISKDKSEVTNEIDRLITSVKAGNIKYIDAGSSTLHFYPYNESEHAGKPTYQLYAVKRIHKQVDPVTNEEYEIVEYVMSMVDGNVAEGQLSNRFVLLEESQYETKSGLANSGYRRAVRDGGFSGYTPLTLEMFWSLMDNYYNDYKTINVVNKTGHVMSSPDSIPLFSKVTNVNVILEDQVDDSTEDSTTEEEEDSSTNESETSVDNQINSIDYIKEDTGSLHQIGCIDADLIAYLAYIADYSDDKGVGGLLNSFINGDIGGMFNDTSITVSNGEFEALVALFQCMYVDWVGNILVDVGTERVIVLPACANKYAFTEMELHSVKQNIMSPLYMQLLSSNEAMVNNDGIAYVGNAIQVPELLSKGSAEVASWDNKSSFFIDLGSAGVLKNYLKDNYGLLITGDSGDSWTDDSVFNMLRESILGRKSICSDFLVYESIKQSGKGAVTDISSSIVSSSLLDSWGSYTSYFSSEGSNKFRGNGNYDKFFSFSSNDTRMLQNLFLTYTIAYTNHPYKEAFDKSKHYIDMRFNYDVFPSVTGTINWNTTDSTEAEIASFIYYFLHPTQGIKYVATWFKNKVSGIFINWHEDVVGSSDSNTITGMTQYLGFSGYVTTPNLEDVSWISSVLLNYNSIIIYLILIMTMILVCYALTGTITFQRAFIGMIMFAFLAFLPPVAINTTVNIINSVCDRIYSSKFDYWAAVQTEEYLGLINDVENAITVTDYVTALMQTNAEASASTSIGGASATGYSGVKIKWLSPKKFNEMSAFSDEVQKKITDSKTGLSTWTLNALVSSQDFTTGMEFYVASDSATYLYRDLLDIYRYGSCSYYTFINDWGSGTKSWSDTDIAKRYKDNGDVGQNVIKMTSMPYNKLVMANIEDIVSAGVDNNNLSDWTKGTSSLSHIRQGYLYPTLDASGKTNYYGGDKSTNAVSLFLRYPKCIELIDENYNKLNNMLSDENSTLNISKTSMADDGKYYGLDQWIFKNGINEYITGVIPDEYKDTSTEHTGSYDGYYYSLYSESPYYFFSFNIRDQAHKSIGYVYNYQDLKSSSADNEQFYNMLLKDNQSYFYNLELTDGYGELRDFMNMHDLFYYVIPALQKGNDVVNMFADAFGMDVSDHSTLVLGADGKITYDGHTEDTLEDLVNSGVFENKTNQELYDFWHDYNVRTVYNEYTPWLNLMNACDYAKPETIKVLGEKFYVENPLDPTSYFTVDGEGKWTGGRYMIFSRSQMKAEGVLWTDLTTVEQKIITIQDNVYNSALDIMNYYNLSNETLISYMAMLELFEFNREFSQTSFIGSDYVLYPQSYELKAFTYDAYLRLILNGATEGSNYQDELQVSGGQSIYERILEKTSIFFGIVLLVNDFVAVYIIPMLKLFFIILIFFVSVLVIIAATTKMDTPGGGLIQAVYKSLIAPLVAFAGVSIGMALIISFFMSEGGGTVTKQSTHISLGDPTMTCIAMLIINVCTLILYWKVVKKVWKDFKTYVTSVFDNIAANIIGAVGKVAGVVAAGSGLRRLGQIRDAVSGKGHGGGSVSSTAHQRGIDNSPHGLAGMGGSEGSGSGGGGLGAAVAGALAGAKAASAVNKYDRKAEALENQMNQQHSAETKEGIQAQHRMNDLHNTADSMKEKYGEGSFRYKAANALANRSEAHANNLVQKNSAKNADMRRKAEHLREKGQIKEGVARQKHENTLKYGKVYGGIKNIGVSAKGIKDSASSTLKNIPDAAGAKVGRLGSMVKNVGSGVSDTYTTAKAIGNAGVGSLKSGGGQIIGGVKKGVSSVKPFVTGERSVSASMVSAGSRMINKAGGSVVAGAKKAGRDFSSGVGRSYKAYSHDSMRVSAQKAQGRAFAQKYNRNTK